MKIAVVSTLLALATTSFAFPSPPKNIAITNITGSSNNQTSPQTREIKLTLDDPNTGVHANCRGLWKVGSLEHPDGSPYRYNCTDPAYQLQFSNGVDNIEDWTLCIFKPDLTEVGATDVTVGDSWKCEKRPGQTPDEVCAYEGTLSLEVSVSD